MEPRLTRSLASHRTPPPWHPERLLLALASVAGASAACAAHGDVQTVEILQLYYAVLTRAVAGAGGRVLKVMGDGVLIGFPASRQQEALTALRSAQSDGTRLWTAFDERCRVRVKVVTGRVVRGRLGPPGEERDDVYGAALNRLFQASGDDEFQVLPETETPGLRR